jgi:hypothetical protein
MSHLLIRSFEQRGTLLHLLKALIEKEVVQTRKFWFGFPVGHHPDSCSRLCLQKASLSYSEQTVWLRGCFRQSLECTDSELTVVHLPCSAHFSNYVRLSLQPLIQSLCDKPNDYSFELDPVKLDAPEDAERNIGHLKVVCQALLDIICSSGPRVPV